MSVCGGGEASGRETKGIRGRPSRYATNRCSDRGRADTRMQVGRYTRSVYEQTHRASPLPCRNEEARMRAVVADLRKSNRKLLDLVDGEEQWAAKPLSQHIATMAVGPLTKEVGVRGRGGHGGHVLHA